jgi:hypothetical protein
MLIEAIGIVDPMPCCLGFVTKRKGKKGGWRLSSTCQHKGGMTKRRKGHFQTYDNVWLTYWQFVCTQSNYWQPHGMLHLLVGNLTC